jgi:hypothetical protein
LEQCDIGGSGRHLCDLRRNFLGVIGLEGHFGAFLFVVGFVCLGVVDGGVGAPVSGL